MSANKIGSVVVIATGGTIAGVSTEATDNIGYTAGQVGIDELLRNVAQPYTQGRVIAEQLAQINSKDMSFELWLQLAKRVRHFLARDDVSGILITHGTDTLEETAYFLQRVCRPTKPVVLTCAMRPTTALAPDGPQNLLDALAVAREPEARGVVVVCAGTVHGAYDVQKVHTYKLDAFSSGDGGPIAFVEEGRLRMLRNWPLAHDWHASPAMDNIANWPRVEIVMSYAGATGGIVHALVAQGVAGLVVAGTGNGTVHHALLGALLEAQEAGVRVVRATRCLNGRVLALPEDAIPDSNGLSAVKARVALMLDLLN